MLFDICCVCRISDFCLADKHDTGLAGLLIPKPVFFWNIEQRLKNESSHIAAMFYTERHWSAWIWLGKPILVNLLWIQLLWNQCIDSKVNQQHETWFLAPGVKLTQKLLPPESNYFRYWQFIWEQPSWERIQMKLWNMRNEVKDNWYLPRRKTH